MANTAPPRPVARVDRAPRRTLASFLARGEPKRFRPTTGPYELSLSEARANRRWRYCAMALHLVVVVLVAAALFRDVHVVYASDLAAGAQPPFTVPAASSDDVTARDAGLFFRYVLHRRYGWSSYTFADDIAELQEYSHPTQRADFSTWLSQRRRPGSNVDIPSEEAQMLSSEELATLPTRVDRYALLDVHHEVVIRPQDIVCKYHEATNPSDAKETLSLWTCSGIGTLVKSPLAAVGMDEASTKTPMKFMATMEVTSYHISEFRLLLRNAEAVGLTAADLAVLADG